MESVVRELFFLLFIILSLPAIFTFFKGLGALIASRIFPVNQLELKVNKDGKEAIVIIKDQDARDLVKCILGASQNAKK